MNVEIRTVGTNFNISYSAIAVPWYAVSLHSDRYSGLYGGSTLVTAYRGTAIAEPRYAVDYYTDVSSSNRRTLLTICTTMKIYGTDLDVPWFEMTADKCKLNNYFLLRRRLITIRRQVVNQSVVLLY